MEETNREDTRFLLRWCEQVQKENKKLREYVERTDTDLRTCRELSEECKRRITAAQVYICTQDADLSKCRDLIVLHGKDKSRLRERVRKLEETIQTLYTFPYLKTVIIRGLKDLGQDQHTKEE